MKVFSEKTKNAVIVCIAIFSVITAVMVVMWLAQYAFNNSLIESGKTNYFNYAITDKQSTFYPQLEFVNKRISSQFRMWMLLSILFAIVDGIFITIYFADKSKRKKLGIKNIIPTKPDSKRKILILGIAIVSALSLSLVAVSYSQEEQFDSTIRLMFIVDDDYIIDGKENEYELVKNAELIKPSQYAAPGKFFGQMLYYVDVVLIVLLIVDAVNRKRKNPPDEKTE